MTDIAEVAKLPGKKVFIKGNHDYWWSSVSRLRNALPKEFIFVAPNSRRFFKSQLQSYFFAFGNLLIGRTLIGKIPKSSSAHNNPVKS